MYDLQIKQRNYKKYAIVCGCLMVFGMLWGFFIFPTTVTAVMKHQLRLKPGYILRKMYETIPFPFVYKLYIFDIKNREGIMNGEKPRFQEVGPYTFYEYIRKVNTTDNKTEDTLEFSLTKKFIFQPHLSEGLTGDEIVTTIHPVIAGMALGVNVEREGLLPMIAKAINDLFHNPKDIFWSGKAMDLIYDGIPIDCTSEDFNAKAVCSIFETGEVKEIQPDGEDRFKFSILAAHNGSNSGNFKVFRGVKNTRHLGKILEINDEIEEEAWDGDECNQFEGTDGLIFPPFNKPEDPILVHEKSVCRTFRVPFERKDTYRGIPVHVFSYDLGDIANTESERCYCRSEDECPLKGTIDLYPCTQVPITVSLPHFYNADPSLGEAVEGLSPRKEDHEIFIKMELFTGIPLSGAKRGQVNFELEPIEEVEQMQNVPKVTFPWIWIDEGVDVPSWIVYLLRFGLITTQRITKVIKYVSMIIGPLATIALVTIHALIETGQISVVNDVQTIKEFVPSESVSVKSADFMRAGDLPEKGKS